jgi:lysophospholipase L1-like esterase
MKCYRQVVVLVGLLALPVGLWGQQEGRFAQWEKAIAAYEEQDKKNPPPKDAFLFVGSSSIRIWDLPKSFPDLPVINRGFGGSQIIDSAHFAARLVNKHQPKMVLLYAGDNDIAGGKSPDQVLADFQAFVKAVRADLPKTPIAYLCIKPSIARWKLIDKVRQANKLIEEECKKGQQLIYIDVSKGMLGDDGMPKAELFIKDGLHLGPEGYKLWTATVRPYLK